jgi:hypothetical protein
MSLLRNSGYPSLGEAVHLLTYGNVRNVPVLLPADVERAYKIYGPHPECVRGQMVKKTVTRVPVDHTLRYVDKNLKLYTDVMHIDYEMFLVSVVDPLNLMLQCKLEKESRHDLGMGLQGQLAILRSRNFNPNIVYVDPQSAFRAMMQDFLAVKVDVGGAADYVSKVDAKIRRIKETYRKVKHGLPWKLPRVLVKDLVGYSVSRLNIPRTQALNENVCPRVLFTGVPVPYKELTVAFGDYVEAYEGTDNTSGARSLAFIALCPVGNSTGPWTLWKIDTRVRVRRTNFKRLVTSELVINSMNALAREHEEERLQPVIEEITEQQSAEVQPEVENPEEIPEGSPTRDAPELQLSREEPQISVEVESADEEAEEQEVRTRSGRTVTRPARFANVTKVNRSDWKEKACEDTIKAELKQLFVELKALRAICRAEITKSAKVLRSHMFLVKKYLADGTFEKVKATLVADGRGQDSDLYPNKLSPTVAIHSVFTVLGLAATKTWRIVVKIDVNGAFIQTPMKGEPTYMKLDLKVSKYAAEIYPELKGMMEDDGCIYTLLLKAMYGCVQASALWYALIKAELERLEMK